MSYLPIKHTTLLILAVIGLMLSGCSRVYVTQDYDDARPLTAHATYQWLPSNMQKVPSIDAVTQQHPFVAKRLEKSLLNHFIQRGAVFVSQSPEAYLSYHYAVTETRSMEPSTTIGFGWQSRHVGFWNAFPMDYTEVVHRQATWTVDIYNSVGQHIWRGQSVGSVPSFDTAQQSLKHTQTVVDAILKQYPPK